MFKFVGVVAALVVIGVAVAPLLNDVTGEVRTVASGDGGSPSSDAEAVPDSSLPPITTATSAEVPAVETTLAPLPGAGVGNVVGLTVVASCTARGSTDSQGNAIDFKPENTLDGDAGTAWRCGGDGAGVTITYTLPAVGAIGAVGAIPGFAANDPHTGTDRFTQNRRVAAANWVCLGADGAALATVPQTFQDSRAMQTVAATGFDQCAAVRFELTGATSSGGRDFVAVSDVSITAKT